MFQPDEICEKCGLHKNSVSPKICRSGRPGGLMFVGEAPGREDENEGKPFSGASGLILRQIAAKAGVLISETVVTHALKCRLNYNSVPGASQINKCNRFLVKDIVETRPKVISALGGTACKAVLGKAGINQLRGTIHKRTFTYEGVSHEATIIPTFHPAMSNRDASLRPRIEEDVKLAVDVLKGKYANSEELRYKLVKTPKDVKEMMRNLSGVVALDIEATGIDPFAADFKILCFALCCSSGVAYCVPVYHKENTFLPVESARKILIDIIHDSSLKLLFHNGYYDVNGIETFTGATVKNWVHDTILMHALLDDNSSHDLASIESRYAPELAGHKAEVKKLSQGMKWADIPLTLLWQYNCGDADATFRIYKKLARMLLDPDNAKLAWIYKHVSIPGVKSIRVLGKTGLQVDVQAVRETDDKYEKQLEAMLNEIQSDKDVIKLNKLRYDMSINKATVKLYEAFRAKGMSDEDAGEAASEAILKVDLNKFRTPFNPASTNQKRLLLFDIMHLKPVVLSKATSLPSCGKDVLEEYTHKPLCNKLVEYQKLQHLRNTYVKPVEDTWLDSCDGRVHTAYGLHTTGTGRTSSSRPNLQNIPRKDTNPDIKNFFTAEPGAVLLNLDYSQMELRILACYSKDAEMLRAYKNGEDIHKLLASEHYKIPFDQVTPEQRTKAKSTNFGIVYLMQAPSLAKSLDVSEAEADALIKSYYKKFSGVKKWQLETIGGCRSRGYVESFIGRRRRLPNILSQDKMKQAEAERQAVNAPIQGLASEMLLMRLPKVVNYVLSLGPKNKVLATVHDSLLLQIEDNLTFCAAQKVKSILENFAEFNFSWLCVPVVVDCEVGTRWGDMKKLKDLG